MKSSKEVLELCTGPETLLHPPVPQTPEATALAIKGNIYKTFLKSAFKSSSQNCWMLLQSTTSSVSPM